MHSSQKRVNASTWDAGMDALISASGPPSASQLSTRRSIPRSHAAAQVDSKSLRVILTSTRGRISACCSNPCALSNADWMMLLAADSPAFISSLIRLFMVMSMISSSTSVISRSFFEIVLAIASIARISHAARTNAESFEEEGAGRIALITRRY